MSTTPTLFISGFDLLAALRERYRLLIGASPRSPYHCRVLLLSEEFHGGPSLVDLDMATLVKRMEVPAHELAANLRRLRIELFFGKPGDHGALQATFNGEVPDPMEPAWPLWIPQGSGRPNGPEHVFHVVESDGRGFSEAVAWELAALLAKEGSRVVLVDADPHSPGLEMMLAQPPELEMTQTLMGLRARVLVEPLKVPTKSGAQVEYVGFAPQAEDLDLDLDRAAFVYDWADPNAVASVALALRGALEGPAVIVVRHAHGLTPCVGALVRSMPGTVVAIDAGAAPVGRRHMRTLMESSHVQSFALVRTFTQEQAERTEFWKASRSHPVILSYDGDGPELDAATARVVERLQQNEVEAVLRHKIAMGELSRPYDAAELEQIAAQLKGTLPS